MLVGVFLSAALYAGEGKVKYLSPLYIAPSTDGSILYIAQSTANRIDFYEVDTEKVINSIDLSGNVSGLIISPDGNTLYATSGQYDGKLFTIDIKSAAIMNTISVGHSPISPVVSTDGKIIYICKRFNDSVISIDLSTIKITSEIRLIREPVAAAITPDGKKLFVANLLPAGRVDGDFAAAAVSIIDIKTNTNIETVTLPNGSIDLRGITVSPDGKYVYVTHVLSRYQLPTTQLERGWMNTNAMTVIDVAKNKILTTVLLDDVDMGGANPWGIKCSPDGKFLCIAHSGTHELSIVDCLGMHKKLDKVSRGEKVSDVSSALEDVPNDLSFLVGLRRRITLVGNGPRNLTIIGTKAYVAEYFTDSLGIIDINPEVHAASKSIKLGPDQPMTDARKGEMFFNDATLCFQKWQSCATCHPGDARPDALNWDLLNDGMGNPKNTKSLLLSHRTPPSMVSGIRATAEVGVRAGIRFIQFAVRPEEDAAVIDEYLKSLKPIPSPRLARSRIDPRQFELNENAKLGKKIFEKANCSMCHSGKLFTDLQKYNVGTGKDRQKNMEFDTPTLIEIWRTSPYLHDGRAATIKSVLTEFNINNMHGSTSDLTEKQIEQLAEYVLSL
ncbi:MAG: c-type cytochrome [Phycisphaerae bacterium]|nr:c-type cytochrome [Phycisphaerae bacterium]